MTEDRIHIANLTPGDVALLKNIATEAAEQTVRRFATAMGIDPEDPLRAQRNMIWLDKTRERAEGMVGKAIYTAVGLAVVGAAHTLWEGAKVAIGFPAHP